MQKMRFLGEFTYLPRLSDKIQTYQTDFLILFFSYRHRRIF